MYPRVSDSRLEARDLRQREMYKKLFLSDVNQNTGFTWSHLDDYKF